jgi:predicted enzyme related to lactoylglutathione lyase
MVLPLASARRPISTGLWNMLEMLAALHAFPESKIVKNRVHLDLRCDHVEEELERLTQLGASVVAEHDDHLVLRDPEGNEFCLSGRR